ncbi:hypothetical protein BX666DRAFT_1110035 [Dichotomocladium elegans]|nr:hypothetical protein BX666DRAFT_1110035 [Dichotomocladium elegans]
MSSAHAFLATVSTKSLDNDGGDLPDHEHKKARDLLDKEHVADEHPSAEEKQREEGYKATHPSLLEEKPPAAFFKIKTKSTPIAPPQQEQKAFNPADVVYEEDIIDLNAPEQCSTDGEDDTSDDGSVVLDQPNISVDPVATAVQTDNVVPKSQDVSKGGTSLADREDKDDTVVPLQFGREENRTNDAKAQKKEELEGTPRDNRAEIQRRLAEQMKKHGGITRVDPTFKIINMTPPASRSIESNKHEDSASDEERIKVDKIAEDIEEDRSTPTVRPMSAMTSTPFLHSAHPSSYMLVTFDQPLISAGSPPYPGTGHLQNLRPASPYLNHHGSYDNTTYMMTPMVYPENLVKAGAPPGMFSPGEHIETTNEVPNADYGYYLVDNSEPAKEDETKKGSEPISAAEGSKKRPEIPSSDPNNRHITVPSVNPGQRVWIRVKPNDTGKSLAQRIHVVATYKSKKILTIKSTSGRIIPLDDTPVFQDWNEIIKLEDGEPWEVEWGPLEHSLLAGIDFLKQIKIKANMRAKE